MTRMTTVADLMSTDVVSLAVEEDLVLASDVMKLARVRHLPVTRHGRCVGLVTHRDLLNAQARLMMTLGGSDDDRYVSVGVADVMTTDVRTIGPDTPAHEAAAMLLANRFGCLPVVDDDGALIGIVTETDFLAWAMARLAADAAR